VRRGARRRRRLGAVAEAVEGGEEHAVREGEHERLVAGRRLALQRPAGGAPVHERGRPGAHSTHLRAVTVVPLPTTDTTSKSSTSRLTPGSPRPSPLPVEY